MMKIPPELSYYFNESHFSEYPVVKIPQIFQDYRGTIMNLADGKLGDVAIITSIQGSIRANHVHIQDWHLVYLISGKLNYHWEDKENDKKVISVSANQLIFTPVNTKHMIEFLEDSSFISISKLSRLEENYEKDTQRLDRNYFID